MKLLKVKYGQIKGTNKAIFGFPGIGNVSKIVVEFLIDKLKAKKVMDIYSTEFPNLVVVKDDFTIEPPKIEVYKYKNILLFNGEVQPSNEVSSYELSDELVKIAKSLGVKEIITIGGIALESEPVKPKVYAALIDKKYKKKLETVGVHFNKKGANIIIGMSGILLFYAKIKKMKGFALLAETSGVQGAIGLRASKSILDVLSKYLKISISTHDLDNEIKNLKKNENKEKRLQSEIAKYIKPMDGNLNYIG